MRNISPMYSQNVPGYKNNHNQVSSLNQSPLILKKSINGEGMNKVATINQNDNTNRHSFTSQQVEILRNSICRGVSNEEFEVFLMACAKTQLDPFMRQIYAVKRKSRRPDGSFGEVMTIQTGIDGYRLIAERTGYYAPGPEPTFTYDEKGELLSSTSYIKKQTKDGTWHTVSASAYFDEYCQTTLDRSTGEKKPIGMWATMKRTMLAKCAEAIALRKAFPKEMSNIYTKEEMLQADTQEAPLVEKIQFKQAIELENIICKCPEEYKNWVYSYLKEKFNTENLSDLPLSLYDRIKNAAMKNMVKETEDQEILVKEA